MRERITKSIVVLSWAFFAEEAIRAFMDNRLLSWANHVALYFFWYYLTTLAIRTFVVWWCRDALNTHLQQNREV